MNLQIRDRRARELARQLAEQRGISMTEAVISALEAELRRARAGRPLAERLSAIAASLAERSGKDGREMTREEIDSMWGHS